MMLKQPINLPIGRNKYRLEEQYQLNFDGYSRIVVPKGFVCCLNSMQSIMENIYKV